ncbi:MAG TPA: hypothetical protein ENN89_01785 [Synergistetes bacterium]|nr:hypothetical protein [Synergistota bacterium]
MLSLVRSGSRGLFLRIAEPKVLKALESEFSLEEKGYDDALDEAGEGQTLLFVPPCGMKRGEPKVFLADCGPGDILAFLLNGHLAEGVVRARLLPRTIIFRVSGEYGTLLEQMAKDYKARVGKIPSFLKWRGSGRTAVFFTPSNLNRPIAMKDLLPDVLFVKMSYEKLLRSLRIRAMTYFNEARGHADWRNLEIRLYDSWDRYDLQVQRLRMVLEEMEVGLLLGEGWGKDYAHVLMPVQVYRFHLATFLEPEKIKEILMGLEYGLSGERLVDLDLYEGKKKNSWGVMARKEEDRQMAGARYRKELAERLTPRTRRQLVDLEKELEKGET